MLGVVGPPQAVIFLHFVIHNSNFPSQKLHVAYFAVFRDEATEMLDYETAKLSQIFPI